MEANCAARQVRPGFGLVSAVTIEGRRRRALSDRTTGASGSWTRSSPSRGVSGCPRPMATQGPLRLV